MSDNLKDKVVRGASWFIAMKWVLRLTGLVSTVVLARILTLEDFFLMGWLFRRHPPPATLLCVPSRTVGHSNRARPM